MKEWCCSWNLRWRIFNTVRMSPMRMREEMDEQLSLLRMDIGHRFSSFLVRVQLVSQYLDGLQILAQTL